MLTRHEDVLLLHNDVRFSSDPSSGGSGFMMRHLPKMFRLLTNSMVYKDDPDHARLRRLVNKAFTPRMVQQMTGDIERIVNGLLDDLERRGQLDGRSRGRLRHAAAPVGDLDHARRGRRGP